MFLSAIVKCSYFLKWLISALMTVTYDEITKTLTVAYKDDPVIRKISQYKEKEVFVINVEGSFTATAIDCFMEYSPVYEINLPDSIINIGNGVLINSKVKTFHIPFNVQSLDISQPFDWCYSIEEFTIDDKQPTLSSIKD